MHSNLTTLILLLTLCTLTTNPARAQAGPPMLTDDPGTAAKGTLEWNTAIAVQKNRDGSSESLVPLVDLSYGLTEHLELSYESHWTIIQEPGSPSRAGWDDTTLGLKWRFWDEEKDHLDASIQPQFTFNTGHSASRRGLVAMNSDLLIPFELGKTLGPVVLNFEFGRDLHAHDSSRADYWFAGLTAGHEFSPALEGSVELYLPRLTRDSREHSLILNLGSRLKLGKASSFLVSGGPGIGGADRPKYVGYLGLQLVY